VIEQAWVKSPIESKIGPSRIWRAGAPHPTPAQAEPNSFATRSSPITFHDLTPPPIEWVVCNSVCNRQSLEQAITQ